MITKNEFYGAYLIACNDNVPDPTTEALGRLTSEIIRAWGVVESLQAVPILPDRVTDEEISELINLKYPDSQKGDS